MRYGNPSIPSRIDALARAGCDRILFVPLYPQYAAATTATACDAAFRHLLDHALAADAARGRRPITTTDVYIDALVTTLARSIWRCSISSPT